MLQWFNIFRKSSATGNLDREYFRNSVEEINIELSNYCNRSCSFCPRERIRPNAIQLISEEVLSNILKDLKSINFSGRLHTHLYNEPLHDIDFWLKCYSMIRDHLPNCDVGLTTNGDYMDQDFLRKAVALKVNRIDASVYYTTWDAAVQEEKLKKFLKRIGITGDINTSEDHIWLQQMIEDTRLHVRSINFGKFGQDRGGSIGTGVTKTRRTTPCGLPRWQVNINYLGEMYPCCNVYPSRAKSAPYVMGSIEETGMFQIYSSPQNRKFREQVASISATQQEMPPACRYCTDPR